VVLVLDDDPIIGELLSVVLGRAGFEPLTPSNPRDAIDVASTRPDAVVAAICDLQLGSTNGAELLGTLSRLAPAMQAIVMSGHPESHIQAELDRAGTEAIMFQKPFRPADMVAAITAP